jgi:hypothetical protein
LHTAGALAISENHPQMIRMLCFVLRIYQNIINKYHHKLVKIIHEYTVHQIHEEGWCIVRPKDITVNSYNPYLVMNVVFGMSEGQMLSW